MDRDPSKVGRAKVVAEMIAEVVNGFVEPISWKTLVRSASAISPLFTLITCSSAFSLSIVLHVDLPRLPDCIHQHTSVVLSS